MCFCPADECSVWFGLLGLLRLISGSLANFLHQLVANVVCLSLLISGALIRLKQSNIGIINVEDYYGRLLCRVLAAQTLLAV